jgi:hypothetical protein
MIRLQGDGVFRGIIEVSFGQYGLPNVAAENSGLRFEHGEYRYWH